MTVSPPSSASLTRTKSKHGLTSCAMGAGPQCVHNMLDKEAVLNTVEQYAALVTKEFSPVAIVLYGSYAKGTPHEDSDIDVAVIFDGFTGDWLETSSHLWRLRRGVSFDIEPILLDKTNDKSGFVQNIFKTGQIIYSVDNDKQSFQ